MGKFEFVLFTVFGALIVIILAGGIYCIDSDDKNHMSEVKLRAQEKIVNKIQGENYFIDEVEIDGQKYLVLYNYHGIFMMLKPKSEVEVQK